MLKSRLLCSASLLISLSLGSVVTQAQEMVSQPKVADADAPLLGLPEKLIVGLEPLVNAAAEIGPRVLDARLQKLAAEAHEEETRSVTRPRANLYLDFSYRENSETQNGSFKPYYNVGVEQPLWHWNALTNQKRVAEIYKKLAGNDYAEARRALIIEIRQAYLDLVLQKLSLAESQTTYDRQRATLAVNRDRSARGEYAADLLATEQLDSRKSAIARDRLQVGLQRALREFAIMNGLESFSADQLPAAIAEVPSSAKALFVPEAAKLAPANRIPDALARREGELEAARLQQEITRVRNYPKVNLAAGADQGASSGTDQSAVVNYFAGVRVRWNIFDGFATRAAVKEARVTVRKNEKAVSDARLALQNQLKDQADELTLSLQELEVAEERFGLTTSREKVDEDLRKTGRLAETEWQARTAAAQTERIALYDLRGRVILQLSEHALLRQRAIKPSEEILFP
ncbi:TolC family protein [Rariglobus hedericola]|uniref:TolC family protein n=1 Tax=Rariglobus hedericola TaxID=2597822 RepID=A0A556QJ44_9BACT|nr:TolC family protein [Rariglobus hedericola]TSJ76674.1 TolC family protein [Rariglobus hedericola]